MTLFIILQFWVNNKKSLAFFNKEKMCWLPPYKHFLNNFNSRCQHVTQWKSVVLTILGAVDDNSGLFYSNSMQIIFKSSILQTFLTWNFKCRYDCSNG